jgi:amidase
MDRRSFLAATATAAALPSRGAHANPTPHPRSAAPPQGGFELEDATIAQLLTWMRQGRYTSRAITELYLRRTDELDRRGPALHAFLETNPDALQIAEQLDGERRAGHERGALHGVPILVKDNCDTADRMHTSAGSLALETSIAPRDSFVVERLRAAGAIILGKANMSEWANFRGRRSISGWSGRGGQCRNPYALDRTPSGSSSGSGAAAAASMCAAAVGTETDGSIISPANMCSLVGIKPTVGLVSRAGIIPIAASQDTAGPMARTVADAAMLLGAMTGEDPRDAATRGSAAHGTTDYTRSLDLDALHGKRLGVARKRYAGIMRGVDALFDAALAVLRERGAVIVDPVDLVTEDHLGDLETTVLLYEYKQGLADYFAALGPSAPVRSLADVIAFNERNRDRELRFFGQEYMERALAKGPLTSPEYRRARATCVRWSRTLGIDALMRQHRLDAIICPTSTTPRPIDMVMGDAGGGGDCTTPAAVAGYPHVTVPMGYYLGLPVGLSFFGRVWTEGALIGCAYAYEQATRLRRPPRFLPTADVDPQG